MVDIKAALLALTAILCLTLLGWLSSLVKRDVSIVDGLWSIFFLLGALVYASSTATHGSRSILVLTLVVLWSLRLSGYIVRRNRGAPEDRRYQAIRARNEPGFRWKSLYLVFGLQAVLACIIATPLFAALGSATPIKGADYAGVALWVIGFSFEALADRQLARFKADPGNRGKVLDSGLWRYSRHPNYFGEACVWWGYFLIAVAGGAAWTVFSPILMTFMLLKVSGVALLESDIQERRPAYRDYIARTSSFFPLKPRKAAAAARSPAGRNGMLAILTPLLALMGCRATALPPIATVPRVELARFMGDWYVIANIPTRLERNAHNAVESYKLATDGSIETTFAFRAGSFEGPQKTYHPRGFVLDRQSNAIWGMRFVWPIKADYRIVYLADDYSRTIIGRQARDYVWIMARTPSISEADYADMLDLLRRDGYDVGKIRKVPQSWPARPPAPGAPE